MASNPKIKCRDMRGKVAIITGGSRGIGRECCLALARAGCHVAVLAKSTTETANLPGTVFTVAKECEEAGRAHGVQAIGVKCDLRDVDNCASAVEEVAAKWGRWAHSLCLILTLSPPGPPRAPPCFFLSPPDPCACRSMFLRSRLKRRAKTNVTSPAAAAAAAGSTCWSTMPQRCGGRTLPTPR